MLNYAVGALGPKGKLVEFKAVREKWIAARDALVLGGTMDPRMMARILDFEPTGALESTPEAKHPAVEGWLTFAQWLVHPHALSGARKRELAVHNLGLEVDEAGDRGQYIIDGAVLRPSEARAEVLSKTALAEAIVGVCVGFAAHFAQNELPRRR